jgi:hypothetical protein
MVHPYRKTPEELLREAESHESALKKGYLKYGSTATLRRKIAMHASLS